MKWELLYQKANMERLGMMARPPRHRPQPFWATFNQPQRSPASGKHRRTNPPTHNSAAGEPSDSTRRAAKERAAFDKAARTLGAFNPVPWKPISRAIVPIPKPEPTIPLESLPHSGVRAGELIGWRTWFIQEDEFLCSMANTDYVWQPGEVASGDVYQNLSDPFWPFRGNRFAIYGGIYCFKQSHQLATEMVKLREIRFPHQVQVPRESAMATLHQRMLQDAFGLREETVTFKTIIGLAAGTIKIWGEVHEHATGYRAQFAKIEKILTVPCSMQHLGHNDMLAQRLSAKYNRSGT